MLPVEFQVLILDDRLQGLNTEHLVDRITPKPRVMTPAITSENVIT